MANITLLPSAKVPLVYDGDNTMTTEWYRFFWNIYGFTAAGVVPVDKGGTGLTTIGDHQVIIGNANNVFEPAIFTGSGINISYSPGIINLAIGASGVTPGTYGSASQVGVFTVNQYGNITAASSTSIGIDASQIVSGIIASARISGSYTGITGVGTLTAGTWNATTIGVEYGGTGQSTYTDGQLLIGNSTGNTLTKATLTAGTGISITNGAGSITIGNTGVLSVSGTAPVVSSGGATPVISMAAANTTTNGYLTSTDWNTFNNKAPATSGTSILYGNGSGGFSNVTIGSGISFAGGTLSATGTGGTVTSVTGTSPVVSSGGTTPAISLATAYGDTLNPYASKTANYFLAAPNGSAGVPTFRAMVAADVPALAYVTSVSGTGSVNGITLTGTVTSSGSLTLGGTLSGIGNSQLTNSTISGVALGGNLFNLTAGTGVSFSAGTTYNGSAAITINATGTGGTVTSVAALTLGTTGTDLSSTVANSTTTPVITLNVPTASAANRGALSAADWTTFNSKAPGVTFTTGYVPFGQGTTTLNQSSSLTFDGTKLSTNQFNTTGASTFSGALFTIGANTANTGPNATNSLFGYRNSSVAWQISNNGTTNGYVLQMQSGSVAGTGWDFIDAYSDIFGSPTIQFRVRGDGSLTSKGFGNFGTCVSVGAATPSTSGAGVTFPATQSASTDANTLDDYEEGTFTPSLTYSTPGTLAVTYVAGSQVGQYTRIGNTCTVVIDLRLASFSKGTASGTLTIAGLPFTIKNTGGFGRPLATLVLSFAPFTGIPVAIGAANGTTISLLKEVTNTGVATLDDPDADSQYFVTFTYLTT